MTLFSQIGRSGAAGTHAGQTCQQLGEVAEPAIAVLDEQQNKGLLCMLFKKVDDRGPGSWIQTVSGPQYICQYSTQ